MSSSELQPIANAFPKILADASVTAAAEQTQQLRTRWRDKDRTLRAEWFTEHGRDITEEARLLQPAVLRFASAAVRMGACEEAPRVTVADIAECYDGVTARLLAEEVREYVGVE